MRHVSVGDSLAIPAQTWNGLLGVLEASRGSGPGARRPFEQSVSCLIRNDTGADLPRYGVVGLSDPLILPADNEDEFLAKIGFAGVLATGGDYDLKWGLTVEPIVSGEIGRAIVQGLAYCKLDTVCETAGPSSAGDVDALTTADCGLARVLWRAAGSGPQWAIVCLG